MEKKNEETNNSPESLNDDILSGLQNITLLSTQTPSTSYNEELRKIKSEHRNKIWQLMTDRKLVKAYPPSCFHKIPNFKGCGIASEKLSRLREFRSAKYVKVNPSLAQMHLRFLTLKFGKTLLVPSPSLSEALMYKVDPSTLKKFWQFKRAASKAGSKELGTEVDLKDDFVIDLFVVASTACSPNGVRLGKGLGYAELEWAILYMYGKVNRDTIVVTTVHDCQVLPEEQLPTSLMCTHDLPIDIIVTPSRIINISKRLDKPDVCICWDLITQEQLESIPILKTLKKE